MFMYNWSKNNTEQFFARSLYKVGILDNLFFHLDRVWRLHSSLDRRIKIKSLWLGKNRKVCINGKVFINLSSSQASIKVSLWQRNPSFKYVVWTCRLSPALAYFTPPHFMCFCPPRFFKRRRLRRWWRRRWGRERSWSSASGWRRPTGSIWGSLCGRPPRWAECPPR